MPQPSHLTRAVFSALIANRPYVSRECLHLRRPLVATLASQRRRAPYQQRRHFLDSLLGSNRPPTTLEGRNPTPQNIETAMVKMADLLRARKFLSRPPAHDELVDALRFLFNARLQADTPLTRNEVFLATETYKHLQERGRVLGDHPGSLNADDLDMLLSALTRTFPSDRFRSDSRTLAELIHADQQRAGLAAESEAAYVAILATTGSASTAKDVLAAGGPFEGSLWVQVLKGLLQEAKINEFWSTLQEFQRQCGPLNPDAHEALVRAFVGADRFFDTQRMYNVPVDSPSGPNSACVCNMLEMAVKSGRLNYADSLARILMGRLPDESVIGTLILYHAYKDPQLEHLKTVVHDLLHTSSAPISMSTFNGVIEYALLNNNPTLAQAIQDLALAEGLRPTGKTFALQLQHALDIHDFARAKQLHEAMQSEDVPDDGSDLAVLNRYIAALAFLPECDHLTIMRLTENILARGGDLDPEAIAGLCYVFLHRGEIDELVGILRHRIEFYPLPDRARVSTVFRNFIVDPAVNTQRAFNAYELFRNAFQETSCALRRPLMQSFFDRKRPDLACQVFSHMRQADAGDAARPDADAYQKAFEGIAQCRDVDGLQIIYNMLKLDLQVDLTTKIRNAIMLAHIACQQPWVAVIDHFYKIMDSREGPTYSSFEVAMRACETWPPFGSFEARKIMAVMQSWDLEITKDMYDNYIGALAGMCEFENVVELIERMDQDIGVQPDAYTIGTFYNAIPWQYRKDEVEKWAKQAYPELWDQLAAFGEEINEEFEVRYFKIDRSIDIDDPPLFGGGEWKPQLQREMQTQIEPLPLVHI